MKTLKLNLNGVKALSKSEMKEVNGGLVKTCQIDCCSTWGGYVGSVGGPDCDQDYGNNVCDAIFGDWYSGAYVCSCGCTY